MLMTRLDQLKLATRGLVLDEASHDSLKSHRPTLGAKSWVWIHEWMEVT